RVRGSRRGGRSGNGCRRRGRARGGARAGRRDRIGGGNRRVGRSRGIEQEGVFANHASGGPVELDEQVQERLLDGHGRGHAQVRRAVLRFQRDAGTRQGALVGQVVLPIQAGVGDARGQRIELVLRGGREL